MSKTESELKHSAIVYTYPCGVVDIIHSSCGFIESGWEAAAAKPQPQRRSREVGKVSEGQDLQRSMRRARAKLRRLALANDFRWFVTLTLDPAKIDRNDGAAVARALGLWADNMVRRKGLKYILVPELHRKGGIHFHGFFNDAVRVTDSGHKDTGGHPIYNLPEWTLGFTTAIELYGDYPSAVGYVTKYIGKQELRPMGRWYYSGGALNEPSKTYADLDREELLVDFAGETVEFAIPKGKILVIHTKEEQNVLQEEMQSDAR
ncbi:MAG: hypothetical protein IJV81_09620 [Paludibacteraceae bacterium]|nr:hypothetical protein [Paludibacteraceae bacterium]